MMEELTVHLQNEIDWHTHTERRNTMRQITQDSVQAFCNYRPFCRSNTSVLVDNFSDHKISMLYLHGNLIAEMSDSGWLALNDCGWQTLTTKERLNGVLQKIFGNDWCIFQKDYVWYLTTPAGNVHRFDIVNNKPIDILRSKEIGDIVYWGKG